MDFTSIVVLCAVVFIAVYVVASVYERKHPPVPAGLKMLTESERQDLREHEEEFMSRWGDPESCKDFFEATGVFSGDETGLEPENRQYPRPIRAEKTARGVEVVLQLPIGIDAEDIEKSIRRGGEWVAIDGVSDTLVERKSPGRVVVRAVTRAAFESDLGGDFL
ncbi:hypothetical protein [Corynebacterium amycolatum]|uniref:hypothetical protein n=1 Tax=Corynebacterium amycolatum TaxID=43765 RepID=UPI00254A555E|nr:hypothetical protein [Corynebacterium amycolatum]MDK7198919.1 hypothetical protein [Corynebacterium amycolatum]MDK7198926.1 hypothetical protein [Corynebacterium amycolatum]